MIPAMIFPLAFKPLLQWDVFVSFWGDIGGRFSFVSLALMVMRLLVISISIGFLYRAENLQKYDSWFQEISSKAVFYLDMYEHSYCHKNKDERVSYLDRGYVLVGEKKANELISYSVRKCVEAD